MLTDTPGIHHVTAVVGDAQRNVDFYAGTLGLRFLLRTVNQEDKFAYHLYYGDETGTPGTILTCFPYPHEDDGRIGVPQIQTVAFVVPETAIDDWLERLAGDDSVRDVTGPLERFDERVIRFRDPDGTRLELVTGDSPVEPWADGPVPEDVAIRGLHGVTLCSANSYATASVLETLGFELVDQEGDRVRYRAPGDRATVVDLLDRDGSYGRGGPGTIHHVAVRVESVDELFREREYDVSRVKDRHYFHSLYVREPGGILFELATDPRPRLQNESGSDTESDDTADEGRSGLVDNSDAVSSETLELPPWFEEDREMIESQLPPVFVPESTVDS
ncbi:VOC family protein [Halobacteria archaeon AArc-m2/3/4]|uniref:VOC family protein n=1 Tax=Natronoglomus mannanivorans TaxID=2979990 RepID=A0ABT2QIR4_9EURY|nr:VOC family protein [Halobacteria archaeon AArc-m2/3/4]